MSSNIDIHDRGTDPLPPPWYRPRPGVTEGPKRLATSIIGGLLIDNDEGRRWFNEKSNVELASNHSQDINVNLKLIDAMAQEGIPLNCVTAPRRLESAVSDFLIITHIQRGRFVHSGPEAYDEVYDEDKKPIPGVNEDEIKAALFDKL
ncbi:hypothetical protein H0H87_001558, partial [Tephrocybe sp. NHM501043]